MAIGATVDINDINTPTVEKKSSYNEIKDALQASRRNP